MESKDVVSRGFVHEGKTYVVKVTQVGFQYDVKTYQGDTVVISYKYPDILVNENDWKSLYGDKLPYERLIEIAEQDIRNGNILKEEP
jgi:Fe-S cluster assembly iron-binding protein IscA